MDNKLSIVVSVYNEEAVLQDFYEAFLDIWQDMPSSYELIFVNDGSIDRSREILSAISEQNYAVKVIHFSKNFGHEAAMIAGIDYASGDYIVCMDADLQHPVTILSEMLIRFKEGYDVINMVRMRNASAGLLKNITSAGFYKVINHISEAHIISNASDFFGISKRVADVLRKNYREKTRFLRGYIQNVGFKSTNIEYEAAPRVAGESKYSIAKLFRFSMNTIMTFSNLPLKLGIYAGSMAALFGLIVMVYTIITWARVGTPSGYATIIVLISFMFSVLFFMIGIIGEYIGVLFRELKDRPIYIVEEVKNIEE